MIYSVITIDRRHKRHRDTVIAQSWFEAWKTAINLHGLARTILVKPYRPQVRHAP